MRHAPNVGKHARRKLPTFQVARKGHDVLAL
jgi:hypothetical protein